MLNQRWVKLNDISIKPQSDLNQKPKFHDRPIRIPTIPPVEFWRLQPHPSPINHSHIHSTLITLPKPPWKETRVIGNQFPVALFVISSLLIYIRSSLVVNLRSFRSSHLFASFIVHININFIIISFGLKKHLNTFLWVEKRWKNIFKQYCSLWRIASFFVCVIGHI